MEWEFMPVATKKKEKEIAQPKKVKKPIELLSGEWYDCGFCAGMGEKPRGSVCSVCRGSKRIRFTPPVVRCASCKGRGEEKPRSNVTCTPCRGKGYVSVIKPVEICSTCNGIGRTRGSNLACVRCKGIGVVSARK